MTSNTAPAHPHATWVFVYPALFSYYAGRERRMSFFEVLLFHVIYVIQVIHVIFKIHVLNERPRADGHALIQRHRNLYVQQKETR